MTHQINHQELPLGLSMALVQNLDAMNRFAGLSAAEQQRFIAKSQRVHSRQEMRALVQSLLP